MNNEDAGSDPGEVQLEKILRERDAYKRAKAENDERFMIERDTARQRAEKAELERDKLRVVCEAFAETAEAAINNVNRPTTGMQVPFHGDFASATPSVISRLRWWTKAFRDALDSKGRSMADLAMDRITALEKERDFAQETARRIRCGCFTLDCVDHGAFVPQDVEKAREWLRVR